MLELLAVLLVFASVFLVVVGLQTKPVDPVEARLRAVQTGLFNRDPALAQPFIRRAAAPVASSIVKFIMRLLPPSWLAETDRRLTWAGGRMTLPGFVLIWVSIAVLGAILGYVLGNSFGFGRIGLIISILIGIGVGGLLPQMWLKGQVAQRHYLTRKGLPDALDMMTTSVEAGLSLDAAMIRVAEFQRGPFQDELARAMQDMTLGKSRRDALEEIPTRLNVPEVITFIQAVNQAEVTGAPIGRVLRVQAEQVRTMRRQHAEAQAQRAPLLMIIPLVFFIFPSLFVVLLAPAALTIIDLLTNSQVFQN